MYNTHKLAFTKTYKVVLQIDLDLNPPIKHASLVPVGLGKLKTLTTDNWHREHGRSTEAEQK